MTSIPRGTTSVALMMLLPAFGRSTASGTTTAMADARCYQCLTALLPVCQPTTKAREIYRWCHPSKFTGAIAYYFSVYLPNSKDDWENIIGAI
jgi:hypothetical protein